MLVTLIMPVQYREIQQCLVTLFMLVSYSEILMFGDTIYHTWSVQGGMTSLVVIVVAFDCKMLDWFVELLSVCSTQGGMCSVYITAEDKVVNIACEHLEPVPPEVHDKVSFLPQKKILLWNERFMIHKFGMHFYFSIMLSCVLF